MKNASKLILTVIVCLFTASILGIGIFITRKNSETNNELVVRIKQGFVRGSVNYTKQNNIKYYSFTGIPYAKPPIGPLRFKDPEPAESWDGVRDATKVGSSCLQIRLYSMIYKGNEDCLFLNVYSPKTTDSDGKLLPILVFIHGGEFSSGSGSPATYPPDLFIEQNIIFVAINYRLSALGFLCLQTKNAPGNAGLKDQYLALKWVNENIHKFGGDPNNVTVMGSSAGSASVHFHTFSQLSRGLYQRVIMESGTAFNPWAMNTDPVGRAFALGRYLGFYGTDIDLLVDYLRTITANEIVHAVTQIHSFENDRECLDVQFTPCVEKEENSDIPIITSHPYEIIKSGNFIKVPMLMGSDTSEGSATIGDEFRTVKSYGRNYTNLVLRSLNLKEGSTAFEEVSNKIGEFYLHNQPIDPIHLTEFMNACSDVGIIFGYWETINYLIRSNITLYVYLFEYDGKLGFLKTKLRKSRKDLLPYFPKGSFHADDLGYLFPEKRFEDVTKDNLDFLTSQRLTLFLSNFIKYSNPNGYNISNGVWERCNETNIQYLSLNETLTTVKGVFFPERMEFWRNIFLKYKKE